ncbi:PepSY domain-containing protein [Woodsholea maritima]|uniref:PepSY domain-containing protein n=1 Tax=Woodsholea maritima TaxID=240237 RepID=UPI0003A32993|nr:hypothetical protein [Woodsholea maritima]
MKDAFTKGSARACKVNAMMHPMILAVVLGICAVVIAPGSYADAQKGGQFDPRSRYSADEAREASNQGDILPAREIVRIVRQRYPNAQVLRSDLVRNNPPFYNLVILTQDGERLQVRIDARTGRWM